jgi:hypothetical protein
MRSTTLEKIKFGIMTIMIALVLSLTTVIAQDGDAPVRSLEGVWEVTITPRNCATGVPNPAAAFSALFTYHKDGTLTAWLQNPTITVTRGPSLGLWQAGRGWSEYSTKFVHLRYNLTTGAFIGKQESGGSLTLSDTGDELTGDGWTIGYDASGNPIGTGGCSTSIGTRFKLEQ